MAVEKRLTLVEFFLKIEKFCGWRLNWLESLSKENVKKSIKIREKQMTWSLRANLLDSWELNRVVLDS
jgi:hypothetical protein